MSFGGMGEGGLSQRAVLHIEVFLQIKFDIAMLTPTCTIFEINLKSAKPCMTHLCDQSKQFYGF